jgi:GNAT superfamily N-acetyltransferase
MEIVELDAAGVERHADELAQLLLDAHASNMALGLAAPLTRERAADEWRRMGAALSPGSRMLLAALDDGGAVVGAVHLARAHVDNGAHRAEVQRLVVRADRRGAGIGGLLLDALAGRAREGGITLLWLTTHAGTDSDTFYARRGWTRVGVIPGYSIRPDGSVADNAFFYRQLG